MATTMSILVTIVLHCQLDWVQKHLGHGWGTPPGMSVRAFPERRPTPNMGGTCGPRSALNTREKGENQLTPDSSSCASWSAQWASSSPCHSLSCPCGHALQLDGWHPQTEGLNSNPHTCTASPSPRSNPDDFKEGFTRAMVPINKPFPLHNDPLSSTTDKIIGWRGERSGLLPQGTRQPLELGFDRSALSAFGPLLSLWKLYCLVCQQVAMACVSLQKGGHSRNSIPPTHTVGCEQCACFFLTGVSSRNTTSTVTHRSTSYWLTRPLHRTLPIHLFT